MQWCEAVGSRAGQTLALRLGRHTAAEKEAPTSPALWMAVALDPAQILPLSKSRKGPHRPGSLGSLPVSVCFRWFFHVPGYISPASEG